MADDLFGSYISTLSRVIKDGTATDAAGSEIELGKAMLTMGAGMRQVHSRGRRVFFIGNGGSAAISSHMATDYSKNGGIRASALNDSSVVTCLSNDFGYEHVFAKQLEWHAVAGDLLIAISSGGRSPNILNAIDSARTRGLGVYTLSGFAADNPLRGLGDVNIHLASHEYGFVEVGHLAVLHAVLDIHMGWRPVDN